MTALSLEQVSARRGGRAVLTGVDARFAARQVTAVIGPNGAGKSTLLEVAAGLLAPVAGTVRLGGRLLADIPRGELARRRAYLPQAPRVDWPISVARVVALGLGPALPTFGAPPPAMRARVAAALAAHDLLALADRPATELSGGELARVMLARATVGEPEVVIVDEPTVGLDPRHALDAARRLRALADAGRAVVVALHDLDLALRIADAAVAVKAGRVVAQGPVDEVFTGALIGELFDVPARIVGDGVERSVRFGG